MPFPDDARAQALQEAKQALQRIPGVQWIGYGMKQVDGRSQEEPSIHVYVREKHALASLSRAERIPARIGGFCTDVQPPDPVRLLNCQDISQHSPLIGGISITSFIGNMNAGPGDPTSPNAGTLGFFASMDKLQGPKNIVLVTANHVLAHNNGGVGDTLYQPRFIQVSDGVFSLEDSPESRRAIADINDMGLDGHIEYDRDGSGTTTPHYIDCASAKLKISISSWCSTNCGQSYANTILGLQLPGPGGTLIDKIAAVGEPRDNDKVFKVGRMSGRSEGKITSANSAGGVANSLTGIIRVEAEPGYENCDGNREFAVEGDSGSALVNENRELIGLVFAQSINDPHRAYACHIGAVMQKLEITPITETNPPKAPAGKLLVSVGGLSPEEPDQTIRLRDSLIGSSVGAMLYDTLLKHREEVVTLVNECRPVTVAWHRMQGPLFLSHAVNNARDPDHLIPHEIAGVTRSMLVKRMASVLIHKGSDRLGRDVTRYESLVNSKIDQFDCLHQLVTTVGGTTVD